MKIYYDGFCRMCTGFVSLAKRFSKSGTFIFIPLQKASINIPENFSNTVIIETKDGQLMAYTEAVSLVLENMSVPFKFINKLLKLLPKSMRDRGYRWIAKNRYQWFGKYDSCKIVKEN